MKFTLLANRDEVHSPGDPLVEVKSPGKPHDEVQSPGDPLVEVQFGASLAPRQTDPGGRVPGQYQTLLPRLPRSARVGAGEATLLAPEVEAVLLLAHEVATVSLLAPLAPFCRVGNWIGSVHGTKQPTLPPSLAPAASKCWRPQWRRFVACPRSGDALVARPQSGDGVV